MTIIDFPVRAEAVTDVVAPVAVPRPRRARRVSTSVGLTLFALLLVQASGAALAVDGVAASVEAFAALMVAGVVALFRLRIPVPGPAIHDRQLDLIISVGAGTTTAALVALQASGSPHGLGLLAAVPTSVAVLAAVVGTRTTWHLRAVPVVLAMAWPRPWTTFAAHVDGATPAGWVATGVVVTVVVVLAGGAVGGGSAALTRRRAALGAPSSRSPSSRDPTPTSEGRIHGPVPRTDPAAGRAAAVAGGGRPFGSRARDAFAAGHGPPRRPRPRAVGPRVSLTRRYGLPALVVLAAALVLAPRATAATLVGLAVALYAAVTAHRLLLIRRAGSNDPTVEVTDAEARAIRDAGLPIYTVLVPAYQEPEVLPRLIGGLARLEYPADRLDILLLLEADDFPTIAAAESLVGVGTPVRIVLVPPSEPRTKPTACNFGLTEARGEFVTIYDAEDRPEPLQLRRAVVAFRRGGADLACLQARLSYHNAEQNLLTRWFTLEYDVWFRWLLPGLMATRAPIPLGGTSNHIRRDVLVGMGAWDAWNVTEDADLGIRLARHGWRTAMLGSTTYEEANSDAINWVKQRSRWYKGYLQSFFVALRRPGALHREIGATGIASLVLFVFATPVLALLNPLFWGLTALWWLATPPFVAALFPPVIYYLGMASWMVGGLSAIYTGVAVARIAGKPHLAPAALVTPL